jgi:hypothetical protein
LPLPSQQQFVEKIEFLFGRLEQLEGHAGASGVLGRWQRRVFDEEVK